MWLDEKIDAQKIIMPSIESDLELVFDFIGAQIRDIEIDNKLFSREYSRNVEQSNFNILENSPNQIKIVGSTLNILNVVLSEKGYTNEADINVTLAKELTKVKGSFVDENSYVKSLYYNIAISSIVEEYSRYNKRVVKADEDTRNKAVGKYRNLYKEERKTLAKWNDRFEKGKTCYEKYSSFKTKSSSDSKDNTGR